jgi:hypothetical protein
MPVTCRKAGKSSTENEKIAIITEKINYPACVYLRCIFGVSISRCWFILDYNFQRETVNFT